MKQDIELYAFRRHLKTCQYFGPGGREIRTDKCNCPFHVDGVYRDELRRRDYLPVLFDFEKPSNRDITETVSTLAHMARFVIADITDAKSIPQELMKIVPALPSVPVQSILLASEHEWSMFCDLVRYPWVLEPFLYDDQKHLLNSLADKVIGPAEAKAKEQTRT